MSCLVEITSKYLCSTFLQGDFYGIFLIFQGMIALILETIDKFSQYKSRRQFAHYAGEDAAGKWDDISSYLYLLLGEISMPSNVGCRSHVL